MFVHKLISNAVSESSSCVLVMLAVGNLFRGIFFCDLFVIHEFE